jgi:hypothetical protein
MRSVNFFLHAENYEGIFTQIIFFDQLFFYLNFAGYI